MHALYSHVAENKDASGVSGRLEAVR
jgi:hypothetical protein